MGQVLQSAGRITSYNVCYTKLLRSVLWFINGRNGPDTMADAYASWLPNQPYNVLPRTHPGETVLARVIGAGRDLHPFHFHGNHVTLIGRDGRMLESAPSYNFV